MNEDRSSHITELEKRIADLKARLPKHSTPASMLIEWEDLEKELAATLASPRAGIQERAECG